MVILNRRTKKPKGKLKSYSKISRSLRFKLSIYKNDCKSRPPSNQRFNCSTRNGNPELRS